MSLRASFGEGQSLGTGSGQKVHLAFSTPAQRAEPVVRALCSAGTAGAPAPVEKCVLLVLHTFLKAGRSPAKN